jgi:hypothetical protein
MKIKGYYFITQKSFALFKYLKLPFFRNVAKRKNEKIRKENGENLMSGGITNRDKWGLLS